jgi:DNA repair photolyase
MKRVPHLHPSDGDAALETTTAVRNSEARRGRGSASNAAGRYETERRVVLDDGWGLADADPPPLRTSVTVDATRTIIARNQSPDISFDRSINPYRGCEHGCIYCFARPTHAYLGLSPGLDFESKLFVKPEAAKLLAQELRAPRYKCEVIAIGTNTDPYQPIEREHLVMRRILEVLAAFNHPVGIVTKSALVTRDIDILAPMAAKRLVKVCVSVTTLDRKLARAMEPRAATPERRLDAIRTLNAAGVPCGVMTAPMIPGLNDAELESILEAARDAGAKEAGYTALRLPLEIKDLFKEWLAERYPDRAERVMSLVRQMRGGKEYDSTFFQRGTGKGPVALLLNQRFRLAAKRLGLNQRRLMLDTTQFRPPPKAGDQLALL